MAISRPGHLVTAISGTIGSTTFYQGARSGVLAPRPRRHPSPSLETTQRNNTLLNAQRQWHDAVPESRAIWNTFAATLPWSNRLGIRRPLSGYQAYIAYSLLRHIPNYLYPYFYQPPHGQSTPQRQILSVDFHASGPQTIASPSAYPTDTNIQLVIQSHVEYGPRTATGNTRSVGYQHSYTNLFDFTSNITTAGIVLTPGEHIRLSLRWIAPDEWPSANVIVLTTVL